MAAAWHFGLGDPPRGRCKTAKRPRRGPLVVSARPGDSPAAVHGRKTTRRPMSSLQPTSIADFETPCRSAKRGRSFVNHGAEQRPIALRTYREHTPSSVSNGARLGERELKMRLGVHCPQNARRRFAEPTSGLPRRHSARRGDAPPLRARPRSHTQTSHPARPLADERYLVVRKAALEDAHDLPAMRQGLLPPAEEGVRLVRLPGRQDAPV